MSKLKLDIKKITIHHYSKMYLTLQEENSRISNIHKDQKTCIHIIPFTDVPDSAPLQVRGK